MTERLSNRAVEDGSCSHGSPSARRDFCNGESILSVSVKKVAKNLFLAVLDEQVSNATSYLLLFSLYFALLPLL